MASNTTTHIKKALRILGVNKDITFENTILGGKFTPKGENFFCDETEEYIKEYCWAWVEKTLVPIYVGNSMAHLLEKSDREERVNPFTGDKQFLSLVKYNGEIAEHSSYKMASHFIVYTKSDSIPPTWVIYPKGKRADSKCTITFIPYGEALHDDLLPYSLLYNNDDGYWRVSGSSIQDILEVEIDE